MKATGMTATRCEQRTIWPDHSAGGALPVRPRSGPVPGWIRPIALKGIADLQTCLFCRLANCAIDHLGKRYSYAGRAARRVMQTIPRYKTCYARVDCPLHQQKPREEPDILLTGNICNDCFHLGMAAGQKHQRC